MNANTTSKMMYEAMPDVSGLNKTPGFDPRKFMRKTVSEPAKQEVLYLDLKFKKLWFRLVHPTGRIKVTALKITEQIAIIEAKIFFNKNDAEPVSSFIAQRFAKGKPGSLYIESAQHAAVSQALNDAGFGLQFCDVSEGPDPEMLDDGLPLQPAVTNARSSAPVEEIPPVTEYSEELPPTEELPPADELPPVEEMPPAEEMPLVDELPRVGELPTAEETPPVAEMPSMDEMPPVEQDYAPETAAAPVTQEALREELSDQPDIPVQPEVSEFDGSAGQPPIQAVYEAPEEEQPQDIAPSAPSYTADMPVEEIFELMTLEDAGAVVVDIGTCKGWTLAEVMERRPASLKWYLNGYSGDNNILKAGAKLLLEMGLERKAG